MNDDESAPLIDNTQGRHRNNLYTLTLNDDPVIQRNCMFVQFDLSKIEVHILEEEDAHCVKQLIGFAAQDSVEVSLTLYNASGKSAGTMKFPAKVENFTAVFSWENTDSLTKWIVTLIPLPL